MHIEILVEDNSGKKLLEHIIPKILEPCQVQCSYNIHSYKGIGRISKDLRPATEASKRILLDQLPKILKGYAKTPGIDAVVVVVDSDKKDCAAFLSELQNLAISSGLPKTLFRIAIEEIEAWYLGDPDAIRRAYPRAKLNAVKAYVQDSVCGTWEILADAIYPGGRKQLLREGWPRPGQAKHEWAERIGPHMELERNQSPSFQKLVVGLRSVATSSRER